MSPRLRPFALPRLVLALALGLAAWSGQARAQPGQRAGGSARRVAVDVKLNQTAFTPGDTIRAAVVLDVDEGWHANAHEPTLESLIGTAVILDSTDQFTLIETRYPEPERLEFSFAENKKLAVYSGRAPVFLTLQAAGDLPPERYGLSGSVRIQICNDEICLSPSTLSVAIPVTVVPRQQAGTIEPINRELFAERTGGAAGARAGPGEAAATAETNQIASMFGERGVLLAFLGIFVIGLALNLTPCVYPMASVTVSLFGAQPGDYFLPSVGAQEEGPLGRSFGRAGVYVLGIATTYSVLGTVAAFTSGLFGAALQSPWALGSIGAVLLAMALGMLGAYELQLPASLRARLSGAHQASGLVGLYLSGLVVGVFAAPCIGPPTVALLAFVGSQGDPLFGFTAFTVMGLGLGAPYLVLGTFSGLLDRLPNSGVWMVWVKKLFGVVMVGAALFYLGLAIVPKRAVWAVPATLVGGGLYLGFLERSGRARTLFRRVKWAVGAAAIVAGVMGVQFLQKPSMEWQSYSDEAVAHPDSRRDDQRPALLYFSAEWCVPCIELDRVTFTDKRVIRATEDFARLKVDLTRYGSPEAKALRKRFDVAGVPTLVFLDRNGKEVPESRIVGYVGPDPFLKRVRSVEQTLSTP